MPAENIEGNRQPDAEIDESLKRKFKCGILCPQARLWHINEL